VKSEGPQIEASLYAVVQATLVLDEVVNHPRGGTATGNEENILTACSPGVPKILQSTDELRITGVYPWHFVDKNDLALLFRERLNVLLKGIEGIKPVFELRTLGKMGMLLEGLRKITELALLGELVASDKRKIVLVIEELVYKKCLTDTSPSIDDNKLGFLGMEAACQLLYLTFATYQFGFTHIGSVFDAKVQRNIEKAKNIWVNLPNLCFYMAIWYLEE
jgi:hypothetical protein